jgi:hypothetical protein
VSRDEFKDYVQAQFRKYLSDAIEIQVTAGSYSGDYFEFSLMLLYDKKPRWGVTQWVKLWGIPSVDEGLVQKMLMEAFTDAVASIPPAPELAAA